MKIVLVDDDLSVIALLERVLTAKGHGVTSSPAGVPVLSTIRRTKPDLVVTDLMMAEMDGLELCAEIRKDKALDTVKIVFLSARTDPMWKDKAREAGATGYIEKPVDTATIAETLEGMMGA